MLKNWPVWFVSFWCFCCSLQNRFRWWEEPQVWHVRWDTRVKIRPLSFNWNPFSKAVSLSSCVSKSTKAKRSRWYEMPFRFLGMKHVLAFTAHKISSKSKAVVPWGRFLNFVLYWRRCKYSSLVMLAEMIQYECLLIAIAHCLANVCFRSALSNVTWTV